jgi:hypothetical protein
MKRKIVYTDEPMGELQVIEDFLPPPEDLVFREENVKVTISLSKSSVDFFKRAAKKNRTQYQKMIRRLLDFYADQFQADAAKRSACAPRPRRLSASMARERRK